MYIFIRRIKGNAPARAASGRTITKPSSLIGKSADMVKHSTLVVLTIFLISACAAPISKEGHQVRQIQHDWKNECEFIGIVETSGGLFYSSKPEAKRDMLNKLRNETAAIGGNAFAITTIEVERGFSFPVAQADAYRCPPKTATGKQFDKR